MFFAGEREALLSRLRELGVPAAVIPKYQMHDMASLAQAVQALEETSSFPPSDSRRVLIQRLTNDPPLWDWVSGEWQLSFGVTLSRLEALYESEFDVSEVTYYVRYKCPDMSSNAAYAVALVAGAAAQVSLFLCSLVLSLYL